jgi:O-acetyl-ADP-ribose deacetylase (regulator of RNase III)
MASVVVRRERNDDAMIEFTSGDLLAADVEALVNTVNTAGVMGKGLALQFKRAYPTAFEAYRRACQAGEVRLGEMHVVDTGTRLIINFPTKGHWRAKSKLADVEAGLQDLARVLEQRTVKSVAVPPLGCGLGGLNWEDVRPRIEDSLSRLSDTRVLVFEPA